MLARERRATREERAADLKEAIFMSAIERGTPGTRTIEWRNSSGIVLADTTINIPAGTSRINLNFHITPGTNYQLGTNGVLNNTNFDAVIKDRLIDTVTGCIIAFVVSSTVFTVWEHEQTKDLIKTLIEANKKYFNAVASLLRSPEKEEHIYRPARKEAFVALANLSDNFQRILSEKRKHQRLAFYHQFVSSGYMLTAHIASLSSLIKRHADNLNEKDFDALINNVNEKFKRAECILKGETLKTVISNRNAPITNKVHVLLQQRQKEIEHGMTDTLTKTRITLRELKSITDELEIIDSIVADEIKIAQRIMQ